MMRRGRKGRIVAALAAVALVPAFMSGCSTVDEKSSGGTEGDSQAKYMVPKKDGPLKVGLANSFAGNAWRTQMIHELKAAAEKDKENVASLDITDANNSVDKQISDINDLLDKGVDLLLINAASETALNGVIERAHKQGVMVVSFDSVVSSPYAVRYTISNKEFGQKGGEWLASKLKKGDEVFTLDGVAGTPVDKERHDAAVKALEDKGVKIVGSVPTDWDLAKGQSAANDQLAAHPDVAGIYSQGGAVTLGAINACQQRGMDKIPPMPGEGHNGFLKKWKELKDSQGWESIAPANPPSIAIDAMNIGIKALRGEDPGQEPKVEMPVITQDTLEKYVRPDLPDDFFLPTTLSNEQIEELYGGKSE